MGVGEWAGMATGVLLTPAIALATLARRGRTFHPQGAYFAGRAEVSEEEGTWGQAARRLAGPVLIRVSGGARPIDDRRRDVVGVTVRFHDEDGDGLGHAPGDQDLLFGSFETLATVGRGASTTDTRNLLANTYWVGMRYRDPDLGEVTFRLVPDPVDTGPGDSGVERLDASVTAGGVTLRLQVRERRSREWRPLVDIHLERRVEGEDSDTAFSPMNAGRGVVPVGFVAGLRRVAYAVGPRLRGAS